MKKSPVQSVEELQGNFALLHSGYGGGQYVGRVIYVRQHRSNESPTLILEAETMRYQPRASMDGGREDNLYWRDIRPERGEHHELPLKLRDRLYSLGETVELSSFQEAREPINPEDPGHVKRLTGEDAALPILYAGAPLIVVQ